MDGRLNWSRARVAPRTRGQPGGRQSTKKGHAHDLRKRRTYAWPLVTSSHSGTTVLPVNTISLGQPVVVKGLLRLLRCRLELKALSNDAAKTRSISGIRRRPRCIAFLVTSTDCEARIPEQAPLLSRIFDVALHCSRRGHVGIAGRGSNKSR